MSKQELVISLLVSNEVKEGIIDQNLYDFIVESVKEQFKLNKFAAQRAVTEVLKSLYMVKV